MRILIAEDQVDIGELMTTLIAGAGHEACLAPDGATAVNLAGEVSPQVVLLDVIMPGIDGYETARQLRDRYGDRFQIYAVTATPMDMPLAEESGFDGIFAKPFDIRKLAALLAQLS